MTTQTEDRVLTGAAWLDEQRPGWEDLVNTDELDMISNCILDQVFADQRGWFDFDNRGDTWLLEHAFLLRGKQEWTDLITARREEKLAAAS